MPEVQEQRAQVLAGLKAMGIDAYCISAATYEGVDAVLDGALRMLAEQPATSCACGASRSGADSPSRVDAGQSWSGTVRYSCCARLLAERIVRRVDLGDWQVQVQLWQEFRHRGIVRALEKAGARSGSVVRIGEYELEWK